MPTGGSTISRNQAIDEIDIAIISMLQAEGRRPYADIAAELGLAASTVQQRANRLIDLGLLKIRAVIDPMTMGVPIICTIAIKVDGIRLQEAAQEIALFEEVSYVVICTGPYDILIEVACQDNDDLLAFLSSKLAHVDGIRSSETFLYLRVVKNTYQWGLP